MTIDEAVNRFNMTLIMFPTLIEYSTKVPVKCISDSDGFHVTIDGIPFFKIGKHAFDQIPIFAYCTICIMREFYLEVIERRAD